MPEADPDLTRRKHVLQLRSEEIPRLTAIPPGCAFHTRCPRVMARCKTEQPQLRATAPGRAVACHLHDA